MWIVFGTKATTARVPGGLKVERRCMQCNETATFYEKELTSTFRLYFIDVFDYRRHRVMACGCCGACYATDELGLPGTQSAGGNNDPLIGEQLGQAAQRVGGYVERAASAVGTGLSSLFSDDRRPPATPPLAPRQSLDDELDLLADDPMEARFRELERKAREESK
jgi:hypothetical protein